MKTVIEVEITNIKVDDRYYSFDYVVSVNGKVRPKEEYSSDHVWWDDIKGFKSLLKSSSAAQTVLEIIKL